MEKCAEERRVWQEALAEVDRLREALKAADEANLTVNAPITTTVTWERQEKVDKLSADLKAAEERLRTTEQAYKDCKARDG